MKAAFKDYFYFAMDNFIFIFKVKMKDKEPRIGIEDILKDIAQHDPLAGKIILYREVDGEYNRVTVDKKGNFIGYELPANASIMAMVGRGLLENMYKSCVE